MVNLLRKSSAEDKQDDKDEVESMDLSPDPNAMTILQIKPPKKGEEINSLDAEKLYRYQLAIDEEKIKTKKGSYASKALKFMMERYTDPKFMSVAASTSKVGVDCQTEEVAQVTREISWRATARPEGVIAAKRFQEWLNGTPAGPSQAFLKDKEQRKRDIALWENIKYDRLRKSKKQERLERKERAEKYAADKKEAADRLAAEKEALQMGRKLDSKADMADAAIKHENIMANRFSDNRMVPTDAAKAYSLKEWNKGHHHLPKDKFADIERTFPIRSVVHKDGATRANSEVVKVADDTFYVEPPPPSTLKYIRPGDNAEWAFVSFVMEKNAKRAEEFLKERARFKKEEKKRIEKEKRNEERRLEKLAEAAKVRAERLAAGLELEVHVDDESGGEEESDAETEGDGKDGVNELAEGEGEGEGEGGEVAGADPAANLERSVGGAEGNEEEANGDDNNAEQNGEEKESKKKKIKKRKKQQEADLLDGSSIEELPKGPSLRQRMSLAGEALHKAACAAGSRAKVHARRSWSVLKLVAKHGRDFRQHLHTLTADGAIVVPLPPPEPVMEPWEVPPGHELRLTRSERKHLERLKRKVLEERRLAWEEENSEDAIQARLLAEHALNAQKKFSLERLWQDIVAYVSGTEPEYKKSKAQKLMEQRAKQAAAELKADEGNASAMELLFTIREKQRQAEAWMRDMKEFFFGVMAGSGNEGGEEFQVDDLIRESRAGNVNGVIDLLDHDMYPIGPNDVNPEGVSAFFVCLTLILNNEGADVASDLVELSFFQRILRWLNKRASEAKLDLAVRILMHRGGDINFRKQERDGDGLAILHMAAENGATKMIDWLIKKKAQINLKTTYLKRTALMLACRSDKLDTVMMILRNGGMLVINDQDTNGWAALHFAASFASPEVAMVLMLCGAKVNARNSRGLLPLEECQARGRMEMIETMRTFKDKSVDYLDRMLFVSSFYPLPAFQATKKLKSVAEEEED